MQSAPRAWDIRWAAWAAGLLAAPLLLPALHGVGGALQTIWDGQVLAGGGTLWPGRRVQWLLGQGLLLAALSALLATAVGALCAWALLLPQPRSWRLALVALLAASFCFGTVVHLLAWRAVFPVVSGGAAGWAVAVLTLALRYAPLSVALLATGLAALEKAELETALSTGGGAALWVVARRRLLRLAGMSVAAVGALVFCESELPPLLGVHVYAEEFLSQVALEPSAATAAALGWPLMAVALACAALLAGMPRLRPTAAGAVSLGWIGQWAHPPTRLRIVLPILSLGLAALPLLLLAWGSVQATGRWPAHAGAALVNSLWVAGVSALVACLWGWALSSWAVRAGGWAVPALNVVLWVMMLWPSALTGIALAGWAAPDWAGAATPLIVAHALRVLPFAAWLLLALRDAQPRGPAEQLSMLGARSWSTLRHVHLPAAWPGLIAAFMLCAGLSLAELTATVLTVPPGMETVILRLYNLLHYGDQRGVMMLALVQGLSVSLAVAVAMGLLGGGVLEIDEIRVQRPGFGVRIGGVSLPPARRLTIIGPSGCGKSTLLRALIGLEPLARVRGLRWQAQDISVAPPHRRPFGWLPQELGLWPHLDAIRHLAFARSRGRTAQPGPDDETLLAEVGLAHRARALPAQLSGGERQRLAFARVMALRPAWAVLDEPFSHLDPVMAHDLADSFRTLARRLGMGLIQVSHQVRQPADDEHFWALENGALAQAGSWLDLKTAPATPWIARFVGLQS